MITFDKLQELIDLLDESPTVTELSISVADGEQITIKKQSRVGANPSNTSAITTIGHVTSDYEVIDSEGNDDHQTDAVDVEAVVSKVPINANRVGVFHTAKPAIKTGETIKDGQIVGFIEAIKLMNEVRANTAGVLVSQYLEDGTPVEYGQQLFDIQPVAG